MSQIAEILLAQIWNAQWFRQPMRTTHGAEIRVVYPGVWTHGFGPDFTGAMIDFEGHLHTGDVEIDLSPSGWIEHGHDSNPRFDDVILHVVARRDDWRTIRRSDGQEISQLCLTEHLPGDMAEFPADPNVRPLGAIGFEACAPGPAEHVPERIDQILERSGDRRMSERVATISGELALDPPGQVLYARMLDALGFSRNREPMTEVASRLAWVDLASLLERVDDHDRFSAAAGLLLGVGGFLPLAPGDAAVAGYDPESVLRVEHSWRENGQAWHARTVSPSFWTLSRSRPAAHPVRRLLAVAHLLSVNRKPLVESLLDCLTSNKALSSVRTWLYRDNPYLGGGLGHEIIVNVVVPFGIAYGDMASQPEFSDQAAELWQRLPAGRGNSVTRRTLAQICGEAEFRVRSARAEQGLIHINRNGCSQFRCYECPIAHLALRWETG